MLEMQKYSTARCLHSLRSHNHTWNDRYAKEDLSNIAVGTTVDAPPLKLSPRSWPFPSPRKRYVSPIIRGAGNVPDPCRPH